MVVRRQIQYGDDNRPMEVLMESNHLAVLLSADTLQPGGGFSVSVARTQLIQMTHTFQHRRSSQI